jgi:hypothetical protein
MTRVARMKRPIVVLVACLVVHALSAAPAHANIWRWIDELSGPGPFKGVTPEFRLTCWGAAPLPYRGPDDPVQDKNKDKQVERITGAFTAKFPCPQDPGPDRFFRFSLNMQVGVMWGKHNPIQYPGDLTEPQKQVMLFPIESLVYWQPILGLEIGAGGGLFVFQNSQLFPTLFVPVIDPIRIDVRPFDLLLDPKENSVPRKLLRTITLRYGLVAIPQKLDATYFGGSPSDPFTPRRELLHSVEFAIDIEPLLRKTQPKKR